MTSPAATVLVVTSSATAAATAVPVLAALEANDLRLRAIDVGSLGADGGGVADRVRRAFLGETAERRLRRELEAHPVDVALAFDAAAAQALTVCRDALPTPAPVIGVCDGLAPPAAWAATDVDRLLCVDDVAAAALVAHGVEADRLIVVGAFAEWAFAAAGREAPAALRSRFALGPLPVVVEVAGMDPEALSQLAMQLSLTDGVERMHFLFAAAGDVEAAAVLRRAVPSVGLRAKLFGATADAPLLWRAAEVAVVRPRPGLVQQALVTGTRLVVLDDGMAPALVTALEQRGRAAIVKNPILLAQAIDHVVRAAAPLPWPDAAHHVADIATVVAGDRRAILDARRAVARAATEARVRAVQGQAAAASRLGAMPGDLEDLGGEPAAAGAEAGGSAIDLEALRAELEARIAEQQRAMNEARVAAERLGREADGASARGDQALATERRRRADGERARMHAMLGELATLETERAALRDLRVPPSSGSTSTGANARGSSTGTSRPPSAAGPSVDDDLAALKRRTQAGAAASAAPGEPPRKRPGAVPGAVDDALAALKRKMRDGNNGGGGR